MRTISDYSLYLVLSEEYGNGRTMMDIAEEAISGGVDILQMREKNKSGQELAAAGKDLSALCREKGVTFIVNDDPILAMRVNADGVHLGQDDIERFSIEKARDILGRGRMIGISTHSLDQFNMANNEDVDYIAFGPIFPTKTKNYHIGTGDIGKVLDTARRPVFFIGGINLSNIDEVLAEGAKNIALIRGIMAADDIAFAAKQFKERLTGQEGERSRAHTNKR